MMLLLLFKMWLLSTKCEGIREEPVFNLSMRSSDFSLVIGKRVLRLAWDCLGLESDRTG